MTYAPADLAEVRGYLIHRLDLQPGVARASDLERNEVGIVGNAAHISSGGYHVGADDLTAAGRVGRDYSVVESSRDRTGLSNAASALDIGDFTADLGGRRVTLRSLSAAIVDACRRGDPRTRDVREVIWSPDGTAVTRWDRLGIRSGGDSSHRWHTHISFFRDSEGRRARPDNFLGLLTSIIDGGTFMAGLSETEQRELYDRVARMHSGAMSGGNVLPEHTRQILTGDPKGDPKWGNGQGLYQLHRRVEELAAKVQPVDTQAIVAQVVEQLRANQPTAEQVAMAILRQLGTGQTPPPMEG